MLKSMDQVTWDIQNVLGWNKIPFEEKIDKAVFRGRDSNQFRIEMTKLSMERPDLIDAGITKYFFFEPNPPPVQQLKFSDFFKVSSPSTVMYNDEIEINNFQYKFILNIDGTVAAYRFPFLLSGNSVVLKQKSPYHEFFYPLLIPDFHFISFGNEGFLKVLENLKLENNETFLKIIKNGKDFVKRHLQPLNIFCYHVKFLLEYSSRFRSPENLDTSQMEEIKTLQDGKNCNCKISQNKTEL